METPLILEINIEPIPQQSARFYRFGKQIRSFQPQKVLDYKKNVRTQILAQLPRGFQLTSNTLNVQVDFMFKKVTALRKKQCEFIDGGGIFFRNNRPDIDNLSKALFDCLTGIVWKDDSQVCDYHARKYYAKDEGKILIAIEEINIS